MPDDPGQALKYVAAFLPGFIGLGLACYLVDLRFDEFYFAFIAIALSAASYGVAMIVLAGGRWLRAGIAHRFPNFAGRFGLPASAPVAQAATGASGAATGASGAGTGPTGPATTPTDDAAARPKGVAANAIAFVTSLVLGLVIAIAYDHDWGFAAVSHLPDVNITKTSSQRPLLYVIDHLDNCKSARRLDAREDLTAMPTQTMLRVVIKDYGTIEGFVRIAPTELDPDEVYLSPACHIVGEAVTPVAGPGVLVKTDSALAVELIDASASKCWVAHFPYPPCVCPSPEISAAFLARKNAGLPLDRQYKLCK
jgi:hypothetical protein